MRRAPLLLTAALITSLASCSSSADNAGTPSPAPARTGTSTAIDPSAGRPVADWPTYHGGNDRAGYSATPGPQPPLRIAWRTTLDAAVYAQPILAEGRLIAATEGNSVYALDPATGRVRWQTRLGRPQRLADLPCGNIDPLGITGTPAYDGRSRRLFVVTETSRGAHTLVALDAATGRVGWRRSLDVVAGRDRMAEQQRSALLVAQGRVYVAFGGLYGDCGNYVGYLAAVATDGRGPVLRYAVPTDREAGMWAPPGPVIGPGGSLYVASGNGAATSSPYDGSDSVIRLSATLHQLAFFAPSTWPEDNAADLDLGSTAPLPVGDRLVMGSKRGVVYLLDASLGGIGGQVGSVDGCATFGGAAVRGLRVVLPCTDGIRALDVAGDSLRWRWRVAGANGSPLITADTVWSLDRSSGALVSVALSSGRVFDRVRVGAVTRFATPVPAGRYVVVGTTRGVVAVGSGGG